MRRWTPKQPLVAAALVLALVVVPLATPAAAKKGGGGPAHATLLIDYSTVTAPLFAAGLPQDNPFDGVVVRGSDDQDPWQCQPLGSQADDTASVSAGASKEGRYNHDFLHVWTLNFGSWDWKNAACTTNLVNGLASLAATASAGNFDGLALDVESYGQTDPFGNNTASEYKAEQDTGKQIGRVLAGRHEVLFMTMAESGYLSHPTTFAGMPYFVRGVLSGGATVVDGNLPSYYYTSPNAYQMAQQQLMSALPGEQIAQATYLDVAPNIQSNVTSSLLYSNQYAWVYTDGAFGSWWGTPAMSPAVVSAVEAGRGAAGLSS